MSDTALEAVLRRDRTIVTAALVIIAVLAWAYVLWLAADMTMQDAATPSAESGGMAGMDMSGTDAGGMDMSGMDMGGMDMGAAVAPGFRAWAPVDFAFIFAMWAVMMVGMMTPSVAPMVLLYAGVGRKARAGGRPIASTAWFFTGYLLVWVAFSVAATGAQWLLASLTLLSPMMATNSTVLGGLVLIAAGLYQWTPMKGVCLQQCQAPIAFLASHGGFRSDPLGALRFGIHHGAYCLGCCWALMALLLVGGVMNVLWIAGIAILVLLEKTVPTGQLIPRISGTLVAAIGAWLLVQAL
jgi:predicted metal-binding membrane protein